MLDKGSQMLGKAKDMLKKYDGILKGNLPDVLKEPNPKKEEVKKILKDLEKSKKSN